MDETSLHGVLGRVVADEPPMGNLAVDAVRTGRAMRTRRRLAVGAGTVVVVSALLLVTPALLPAGAQPPTTVAASVKAKAATPWPTGPSAPELSFPLDPYGFSTSQLDEQFYARAILIDTCMAKYGFPYDAVALRAHWIAYTRADLLDFGAEHNTRQFGLTDPGYARANGYRLPSEIANLASPSAPLKTSQSPDYLAALDGTGAAKVNGVGVLPHGCAGQAAATLLADGMPASPTIVDQIELAQQNYVKTNAAILAAGTRWSSCMATKGYHYDDYMNAGTDPAAETLPPSSAEIAEAVADVGCKQQSGLTTTILSVVTAYENDQIAAHKAALDAFEAACTAFMTRIDAIVAGG
jgi:hypothetical protein